MAFKMKNPMLAKAASKASSPMQANYSPMKKRGLKTGSDTDSKTAEAKVNAANQARANAKENKSANVDDLSTKEEAVTKAKSPMMQKQPFSQKPVEKSTKQSGNLKDVIKDVRTKAADVVGKISQGFVNPMIKASEAGDRQGLSPSGIANIGGALITGAGRVITKAAENILRPGQQTKLKEGGVISGLLAKEPMKAKKPMKAKSPAKAKKPMKAKSPTKAKKPMKAKSPVKAKKPMKAKSPTKFNAALRKAKADGKLPENFANKF